MKTTYMARMNEDVTLAIEVESFTSPRLHFNVSIDGRDYAEDVRSWEELRVALSYRLSKRGLVARVIRKVEDACFDSALSVV